MMGCSLIITSNQLFSQWDKIFPDTMLRDCSNASLSLEFVSIVQVQQFRLEFGSTISPLYAHMF